MKTFCIIIAILKSMPLFAERGCHNGIGSRCGRLHWEGYDAGQILWAGSFNVSKITSSRPLIWRLDNTRFATQRCQGLFAARRLRAPH